MFCSFLLLTLVACFSLSLNHFRSFTVVFPVCQRSSRSSVSFTCDSSDLLIFPLSMSTLSNSCMTFLTPLFLLFLFFASTTPSLLTLYSIPAPFLLFDVFRVTQPTSRIPFHFHYSYFCCCCPSSAIHFSSSRQWTRWRGPRLCTIVF